MQKLRDYQQAVFGIKLAQQPARTAETSPCAARAKSSPVRERRVRSTSIPSPFRGGRIVTRMTGQCLPLLRPPCSVIAGCASSQRGAVTPLRISVAFVDSAAEIYGLQSLLHLECEGCSRQGSI